MYATVNRGSLAPVRGGSRFSAVMAGAVCRALELEPLEAVERFVLPFLATDPTEGTR